MKTVVAYVKYFESVKTEETSRITILVELTEKGLESILLDLQDPQQREVAKSTKRGKEVVVEVKLPQVGKLVTIEHLVEVSQLAARQVEFLDVMRCITLQSLFKDLISETTCECLLGLDALGVLDAETVEHPQPPKMEDAIDPVVLLLDEVVAGDVENDQSLQLFKVNDLLDLIDLIVAQVELH